MGVANESILHTYAAVTRLLGKTIIVFLNRKILILISLILLLMFEPSLPTHFRCKAKCLLNLENKQLKFVNLSHNHGAKTK